MTTTTTAATHRHTCPDCGYFEDCACEVLRNTPTLRCACCAVRYAATRCEWFPLPATKGATA